LLLQQQFQLTRLFKHQTLKEVEMLFWDRKYFLTIKLRKCSLYLMYLSKQFCSDIYNTFLPKIIYLYIINVTIGRVLFSNPIAFRRFSNSSNLF
jgi:hypothetical protein